MYKTLQPVLAKELQEIEVAGLYKKERIIVTPQGADIRLADGKEVVNFVQIIIWGYRRIPKLLKRQSVQ